MDKLVILDRNTRYQISVGKLFILHKNTRYHITVGKLVVLDRNTRYQISVGKLFVLDKNTRYHITVGKLFVLGRNTRYHITVSKLLVLDKNTIYHIIIIILSHRQRWSPWPSPANLLYRPSLLLGPQGPVRSVSAQICCMYVLAGHPVFARPCEGVHRSMSLMNSSLLLQQCPACLVSLTWIVFVVGGRWPCSSCLWGVACRTCSIQLTVFLCNWSQAFSP